MDRPRGVGIMPVFVIVETFPASTLVFSLSPRQIALLEGRRLD